MEDPQIHAFRNQLKTKYDGTFSEQTERILEDLKNKKWLGDIPSQVKERFKETPFTGRMYDSILVDYALYIVQMTQTISASCLGFFHHMNYGEYLETKDTAQFRSLHGSSIDKIKAMLEGIFMVIPDLYYLMGFDDITIDPEGVTSFNISKFFHDISASHVEISVIINRSGIFFLDGILELIDDDENIRGEYLDYKRVLLSSLCISSQGMYNLLFKPELLL